MKNISFLFLIALICSCNMEKPPSFLPYLIWPDEEKDRFRMFYSIGDNAATKIMATQAVSYSEDSVVTLEYLILREDTIPINKSQENWYPDNSMELMSNSFYEFDDATGFVEVKGIAQAETKWDLKSDFTFEFNYKFITDPGMSMTTHSTFNISKAEIDSIFDSKTDCMVLNSITNTNLRFTEDRKDTIITSSTIRIYKKNKGLVYFSNNNGVKSTAYQIVIL